jgi:abequosyltransferase
MQPLLTIALPTYNREKLLDKQLSWLADAIKGHEPKLEILISDNCSTDSTPDIIEKWRPAFDNVDFRTHRHARNVGAVGNVIEYCMQAPRTPYVWVISDDDPIDARAIPFVLQTIEDNPGLAVIVLNFSSRDVKTGRVNFERCYHIDDEHVHENGMNLFGELLYQNNGGVTLTTALVYRTDLVKAAIREWPEGLANMAVQMYLTGYAAAHGPTLATKDTYLECAAGDHYFMNDPRLHYKIHNVDVPEVYARFLDIGYPRSVFTRMFWQKVKRNAHPRDWPGFLKRIGVMLGRLIRARAARWLPRHRTAADTETDHDVTPATR